MRILYIAKHQSGGSDDEGAIAYALRQLGHEVNCMPEEDRRKRSNYVNFVLDAATRTDLILFHKWQDDKTLKRIIEQSPNVKRVMWYFDLVAWPSDPTLKSRSVTRLNWMNTFVPLVDLGFCTDGDFVLNDPTGKLIWLPQGADERIVGRGTRREGVLAKPILFTGIVRNAGEERGRWFRSLEARFPGQITHYSNGVYREELRDVIASHMIVVCPDSPVTDYYWSNRVWNAMGFGAFVIHPWSRGLARFFENGTACPLYYDNREQLYQYIEEWLPRVELRHEIGDLAIRKIMEANLYRHRCEEMLEVIAERLGVK